MNSKTATKFRRWATTTLREHITQGYTINPSRIEQNYEQFLKAVEEFKKGMDFLFFYFYEGDKRIFFASFLAKNDYLI